MGSSRCDSALFAFNALSPNLTSSSLHSSPFDSLTSAINRTPSHFHSHRFTNSHHQNPAFCFTSLLLHLHHCFHARRLCFRSHHHFGLPLFDRRAASSDAMTSKTVAKDIITLRGSAAIVSEFFGYAANSILYNRGVYPEESFVRVKKYGLPMLLTQDEGVKSFIASVTAQLSEWLEAGKLQRVVLVIMSKATGEVLERWNFSIETDGEVVEKGVSREKSDKEIMREIQAIMRQIASSITYLPCLDESCAFDVLAYTDKDVAVPFTWIESDPKLIANPQMVKLHSFDTKIHKVDTLVSYKTDEWDEQ